MSEEADAREALVVAKKHSQRLIECLPVRIEAVAMTTRSKLPFKALGLRELLIHRMTELANSAVELFEKRQVVAGIVLTRAVVETVAVTFALHKALKNFRQDRSSEKLDSFLVQTLMGSRWPDWDHRSTNILTLVQHVEREIPGFEASYNGLSEVAHPNWSGVLGSFGKYDAERLELNLGSRENSPGFASGTNALAGALQTFEHFYNDMAGILHEINSYFDAKSVGDDAT